MAGLAIALDAANGDPVRHALRKTGGRRPEIIPQAYFISQNVGSTPGENPQGHAGVHHAVHHLVDGAVAARGNDQIGALLDAFSGDGARRGRTRGGKDTDAVSGALQDSSRFFQ